MIPPTWIVTGASRGFGFHLATAALVAGLNVVATARDLASLAALQELGGSRCLPVGLDLVDPEGVAKLVPTALDAFGQVDVLINNAGSGLVCAAEDTAPDDELALMRMHYHAPMALIRAVLPAMRDRGQGSIVNMGAAASHGNYAGFSAYGAAKAALECASDALRAELLPMGIGVSVIIPGPFRTGFIEHAPRASSAVYAATVGRFASVLERMNGRQPGDPDRAAALMVEHLLAGNLPARLPLGAYVVKKLRDRANATLREVEGLEATARSADYPLGA
jgi:NAD(P)-dependent dehydrogenase (short-subunit alcohol dehydrogenase family)